MAFLWRLWTIVFALRICLGRAAIRGAVYANAVLAHRDFSTKTTFPNVDFNFTRKSPPPGASLDLFSARLDGTLVAPDQESWQFLLRTNGAARLWIDDHILVDTSCDAPISKANGSHVSVPPSNCGAWTASSDGAVVSYAGRDNVTHHIHNGLHMRLEWLHYGGGNAVMQLLWRPGTPSTLPTTEQNFVVVPESALTDTVKEAELWRQAFQENMSRGWNTWMRESAARHIHLPSAFGYEVTLWDSDSKQVFEYGLVDKCRGADADSCKIKPGFHSFNGSVTSFVQRTKWGKADNTGSSKPITNVTIASAHELDANGDAMVMLLTPSAKDNTLWAVLTPGFFFDCGINSAARDSKNRVVDHVSACGNITSTVDSSGRAHVQAHASGFEGLASLLVTGVAAAGDIPRELSSLIAKWGGGLAIPLNRGPVAVAAYGAQRKSTHAILHPRASLQSPPWPTVASVSVVISEQMRRLEEKFERDFPREKVGRMRDAAEAMRTVIGWNTVWDQRVKVMTPVSRTFGVNPFIMWDWDTYFLSLMAAESDEMLGYSNVLTVTRGRTIRGQVPNAECAQWTNDDRTEPYVGAMVVREHYRKFKNILLVQLLYDDLITWVDWAFERRLLQPGGLISVGSDVVNTPPHDGHTKQAAIWETGMDNSPMYDQVTWSPEQSKMLIYDIGMTSEVLGELEALADLATALGKTADVAMLNKRREQMAQKVQETLWNSSLGLFFNFQVDTNTFNLHTSPTSFYPMLSGTATPAQALEMTRRWLTNHSGYCITNTSAPPSPSPSPPPIPPVYDHGIFVSTRYSSTFADNALCVSSPTCRAKPGVPNTEGMTAKHVSAAWSSANNVHPECCPPKVWEDGQAKASSYVWIRPEGYVLPGASELAEHPGVPTVNLQMYYSKANTDNYLGSNASTGYVAVQAETLATHPVRLGINAATIFAQPPNKSYVPLDLYWSESRKDYQNVGNPMTRKWLQGYEFVRTLGYVRAPPKCSTSKAGCTHNSGLSPCKFGLPSTPNNDPAYHDNNYWRGRVWGPLNLLVYMGLRHPRYKDLPEIVAARKQLVVQSREALLVEWLPKHHVHENLNPDTGLGDDVGSSNPMYHWGALLGFLEIWESGRF